MTRSRPDAALCRVLRRLRKERGLSQETLAFSSDVTISALSRIERGLSDPVWSNVRAIAAALGMSVSELGAAVEQEHSPFQGDLTSATANEQDTRHAGRTTSEHAERVFARR
jgi:transcriptional regulator with XRE-family HTH domain